MDREEIDFPKIGKERNPLVPMAIGTVVVALFAFALFRFILPMFEKPPDLEIHEPAETECVTVVQRTLNRVDQLPGEIQAYQDVAVYPKVPGFIEWIGVDRGSIVKKNQDMIGLFAPELIAQRNDANAKVQSVRAQLHEAEAKVQSAKAQVAEAKAKLAGDNDTYTRTKAASAIPGVVAPNTVVVLAEGVQADREIISTYEENVRAAIKQVKALEKALVATEQSAASYQDIKDYLIIPAPFDGYITERNMHVGSFVGPLGKGAYPPIVRIQQLNLLRIVTPVPEIDTAGVEPGAEVQFSVSTFPGQRFTGKVARLGNYLEQRTRTMPVELNYWNHGLKILPGMFCEVYWPTKRPNQTMFVPNTAVDTTSTLETFVCRVSKNNEIEWVKVTKGQTMGNRVEVFNVVGADTTIAPLQAGDVVTLKAGEQLTVGMKVVPKLLPDEASDRTPEKRPIYHYH
ncbi:MAG: efflux RND transporter periplasmic adaptor subunit [Candidatus Obscuribacterales bacterium]